MARLSRGSREFLANYERRLGIYQEAALQAENYVCGVLKSLVTPIHAVTARAKGVESLRGKLRRKGYSTPRYQVTDLIGVRIITYFAESVDSVAATLQASLDVSGRASRDARAALEDDKFGYRSVHLIARLPASTRGDIRFRALGRRWFEIQIRSVLDHAWAEIEHEVVYKSGVSYPLDVKRRFRAVAGALEVLENAFSGLAIERDLLVDKYRRDYLAGRRTHERFDVARLWAYLEIMFPLGLGWREARRSGHPFPLGSGKSAVEALAMANLDSAERLRDTLRQRRFTRAVEEFAAAEGLAPEAVSHLAIIVLILALRDPTTLMQQFPEMFSDPGVARIRTLRLARGGVNATSIART